MIWKNPKLKNQYAFTRTSTSEDLRNVLRSYDKFNCIICNENTRKMFKVNFLDGNPPITICKKLADGIFFVNGIY